MQEVSKVQMEDLDQRLIHQYHIPLVTSMEMAGRALVALIKERYPKAGRILVLVGTGNVGGYGLVVARLLQEAGHETRLILTRPEMLLKVVPKEQFEKLPADTMLGVSEEAEDEELRELIAGSDLIIDAMLGYGINGELYGEVRRLIRLVTYSKTSVLAVDLPSGLDPDQGYQCEPVMRANLTASLALPKVGLTFADSKEYIGDVYLLDIGVPDAWFTQEKFARPPYGPHGYVKLTDQ